MNIKLVAIDLDGTFLDESCKRPQRNIDAVKKAIDKGIIVVPATGRSFRNVKEELFYDIEGITYCINANGTIVADMKKEKVLYARTLPMELGQQVYRIARKYPVYIEVYAGLEAYADAARIKYLYQSGLDRAYCDQLVGTNIIVDNLDKIVLTDGISISKYHIVCMSVETKKDLKDEIAALNDLFPISVISKNIELVYGTYSKRDGLEHLIGQLGIDKSQVLVIGDSNNDYDMMAWADHAVAMANANERVKAVASDITASNNEAGVANTLEKYLNL